MMEARESEIGFILESSQCLVVFGGVNSSVSKFQELWPQLNFSRIRQTHSDLIVEKNKKNLLDVPEADAQWTQNSETALCISTADCVPLMFLDSHNHRIASVHAGWRGVAQRLVPITLRQLIKSGSLPNQLEVFIGPHIRWDSFEVDLDVKEKLVKSTPWESKESSRPFKQSSLQGKYLVNLNEIVRAQMKEFGINESQVLDLGVDTKRDLRFHSHRRDKEKSGRQISFIALGKQRQSGKVQQRL